MALAPTGSTRKYNRLANSSNIATTNAINYINNEIASNSIILDVINPFKGLGNNAKIETPQIGNNINFNYDSKTFTSALEMPEVKKEITESNTPEVNLSNEYLKKASEQKELSTKLNVVSGVTNIFSAVDTYNQVKNTKYQYEQQKRVMDLNLKNTESLLLENYRQTMSDIDATMAAKNVDLSSQGLVNMKRKGLMNMGEDIALQNQQNDLNKAALDLQYAYNKAQAKSNMTSNIASNAVSIGMNLGWI